MEKVQKSPVSFLSANGDLKGNPVQNSLRRIKDLQHVFKEETARQKLKQEELVYEVQAYFPVEDGKEGGLFFGNSTIYPGKVGEEYFMTKGHFHEIRDRGEYYWCIQGEGMLILMDENRKTWGEQMKPGSLHYIPGRIAHRVANTGNKILRFGACWPSDAGHDYQTIAENGFGARLVEKDGKPVFINA